MNKSISCLCLVLALEAATVFGQPEPRNESRQRRGPPPLEAALDTDRDGYITPAELKGATEALRKLDINGDGKLTIDEYGRPRRDDRPGPIVPLEKAIDADGDGVISATEMAIVPTAVMTLDNDADGKVSRAESQPPRPPDRRNGPEEGGQGGNRAPGPGQNPIDGQEQHHTGNVPEHNENPDQQGDLGQQRKHGRSENNRGGGFTMAQTLSDEAQWTTIAFDGIGFLTGSLGADSWFPPGKVADFWGFQYLRDNDSTKMGHNTDFLTRVANNTFAVLTADQKAGLVELAKKQVEPVNRYGYKRFVLMKAFRRLLSGDVPATTSQLSESGVRAFSAQLYRLDGEISYDRALVMGRILNSLSSEQQASLRSLVGKGIANWPDLPDQIDKRLFSHDVHVALMTYASDLFSWFAGNVETDVYFCPERQGTYFGAFFIKGGPARGKRNYSINENLIADVGRAFVAALDAKQGAQIKGLVDVQRPFLQGIVAARREVSTLLRGFITGTTPDREAVLRLMATYGDQDGAIAYNFAKAFVDVARTLTPEQKVHIQNMRTSLNLPEPSGAFLYSSPIAMPEIPNTDFLFNGDGR